MQYTLIGINTYSGNLLGATPEVNILGLSISVQPFRVKESERHSWIGCFANARKTIFKLFLNFPLNTLDTLWEKQK